MNAAIRSVVRVALREGADAVGHKKTIDTSMFRLAAVLSQ